MLVAIVTKVPQAAMSSTFLENAFTVGRQQSQGGIVQKVLPTGTLLMQGLINAFTVECQQMLVDIAAKTQVAATFLVAELCSSPIYCCCFLMIFNLIPPSTPPAPLPLPLAMQASI
jgi:hypothetical protein